jgi:hypothetical protein
VLPNNDFTGKQDVEKIHINAPFLDHTGPDHTLSVPLCVQHAAAGKGATADKQSGPNA